MTRMPGKDHPNFLQWSEALPWGMWGYLGNRQSQVLSLIGSTHFWTDWDGRRAREWEKWGFRTPQGESK